MNSSKTVIVTGHFGSGKTEFSINYSINMVRQGLKVALIDLDIVNPFFRTAEVKERLEALGVKVIVPNFAGTAVDVPSLPAEIYSVFDSNLYDKIIFDVGGDDLGATALGRYQSKIKKKPYDMFYVINTKRPLSSTGEQIVEMLNAVEGSSRLKVGHFINNTNLSHETDIDDLIEGQEIIKKVSKKLDIPITYITGIRDIIDDLPADLKSKAFNLKLYMQPIWN